MRLDTQTFEDLLTCHIKLPVDGANGCGLHSAVGPAYLRQMASEHLVLRDNHFAWLRAHRNLTLRTTAVNAAHLASAEFTYPTPDGQQHSLAKDLLAAGLALPLVNGQLPAGRTLSQLQPNPKLVWPELPPRRALHHPQRGEGRRGRYHFVQRSADRAVCRACAVCRLPTGEHATGQQSARFH